MSDELDTDSLPYILRKRYLIADRAMVRSKGFDQTSSWWKRS